MDQVDDIHDTIAAEMKLLMRKLASAKPRKHIRRSTAQTQAVIILTTSLATSLATMINTLMVSAPSHLTKLLTNKKKILKFALSAMRLIP